MTLVSIIIFGVLALVACIHALWAFGFTWPLRDTQTLIDTVIGAKGATRMPGRTLTLVVAAGIGAAGVIALWGGNVTTLPLPVWIRTAGLAVLAAIFLLRGTASYLPLGPLATTVQPFRSLDRRYYAPLILAIGTGYLVLLGSVLGVI